MITTKESLFKELFSAIVRGNKRIEHSIRKTLLLNLRVPFEEIETVIAEANSYWEEKRKQFLLNR